MLRLEDSQLRPRSALVFVSGDNATTTLINGIKYNLTALKYWNYTLYSNNTISNNSQCYLAFNRYRPSFLDNGTWINGTSCYVPINGIALRGKLSIVFATLFTTCLLFALICLKKHGTQYVRESKRFRLVGRRWQWYWMLFVCACGLISTITGADVDRIYLQSTPIILQSFFFHLMYPGTVAMVWEAVRHWGSWQQRQIVDADSSAFRQDDTRSRIEFYMPLMFYLFAWLEFFLTIPRPWTPIEKQRSHEQQMETAMPAATDIRFKAGSMIMVFAFLIIGYGLRHSLRHYRTGVSFIKACSKQFLLSMLVLAVRVGYGIACAWIWDISVMKYNGNPAWPYGLGYTPTLLIMVILIIAGLVEENEDKVLIKQRRARGRATDAELGITRKPAWWRKTAAEYMSSEERLRDMASNFGGNRGARNAAAHHALDEISLDDAPTDGKPPPLCCKPATSPIFRNPSISSSTATPRYGLRDRSGSRLEDPPVSDRDQPRRSETTQDAGSTGSTDTTAHAPQRRIRSMLDV